ncbi:serine/threonine-protein kinase [Cumulibacter manganitolerans]|uniref:serine/threonine-protein kinase n=1 Tax=Cumulibacter manganitolerans TaxID=1884992 RepID=UPI001E5EF441|nr:serine/threonine-protein kinase [Cumulibacter manganitolerans]
MTQFDDERAGPAPDGSSRPDAPAGGPPSGGWGDGWDETWDDGDPTADAHLVAGGETRTRLEPVPGNEPDAEGAGAADGAYRQRLLANRYRLDSLLGRGSMGAVWKAQDVVLGRSVAVKEVLLPPTQTAEENHVARERALREARSIAALSHPNVVTLYDVVEDDGRPWVVMELVPAKSLAQIIKDDGTLPPAEAARIGVAVLAALKSAHEVGITHRDVKPGNILVSPDGRVKLADFGISRRAEDSQLTRTGLMVGSPSYIAPEVARGRPAGPAADIWGLGATLQCAVEGSPPFDMGDPVATLTAVVGEHPRPAPHAGPLRPLLERMLDKDPRSRIRPDELQDALESVAAQRPGPRPTYSPPTGPLAPLGGTAWGGQGGPSAPGRPQGATSGPVQGGTSGPAQGGTSGPMQGGHAGSAPGRRTAYVQGAYPPGPGQGRRGPEAGGTGYGGTGYRPSGYGQAGPGRPAFPTGGRPATGDHDVSAYGGDYGASSYDGGYQPITPRRERGRNLLVPVLIGVLVVALLVGGVLWWQLAGSSTGGAPSASGSATASASEPSDTSTSPTAALPTANKTTIQSGTASGAISVNGKFHPFSFTLPDGWKVGNFDEGRSEFLLAAGGEDPETMVKVTVVAEPLVESSVDEQIKSQQSQEGSPAKLPGYDNVKYEVTQQGNVLWQYTNTFKGADRRGYFYATDKGNGILWKVITAGPHDQGDKTAAVANKVIQTFQAS